MEQRNRPWGVLQRERAQHKPEKLEQTYAAVFGTEAGRVVLDDLCRQAEYPSVDESRPIDPYLLAIKEGRRKQVDYIFKRVEAGKKSEGSM